jgi:hypothetical protein
MPDTKSNYPAQSPVWGVLKGVDPAFISSDDALQLINLATKGELARHPEAAHDLRAWLQFARGSKGTLTAENMVHVANALVTPGGVQQLRHEN